MQAILDAHSGPTAGYRHPIIRGARWRSKTKSAMRPTAFDHQKATAHVNETRQLAEWLAGHSPAQIPETIKHEAKRALLNYFAAAFGGCRHEAE